MTIEKAISFGKNRIEKISETPALDARVILAFILKQSVEFLYAFPEKRLTPSDEKIFHTYIEQRRKGKPVAYIIQKKEFYGLDFFVDESVLIPRPETELIVEHVIQAIKYPAVIIDTGTGSGCIPIAVYKNVSQPTNITWYASDISAKALATARKNFTAYGLTRHFHILHGNLLLPFLENMPDISNKHLIITANLPYLPTRVYWRTKKTVRAYEPKSALSGGWNGLRYYKKLLKHMTLFMKKASPLSTTLFFEIHPTQGTALGKILKKQFPKAVVNIFYDLCAQPRLFEAILCISPSLQKNRTQTARSSKIQKV